MENQEASFNVQEAYTTLAGHVSQLQLMMQKLWVAAQPPVPVPVATSSPVQVLPEDPTRGERLRAAGIKLAMPPKFGKPSKDMNSKQWLRLIQHYCLQYGLNNNDAITIATSLLEEPAATWWQNLIQQVQAGLATPVADWQDWQVRFLQAYPTGDLPWLARSKIMRPVVVQNGSVQDYLTKLTTYFLEAGPSLSEEDKRFLF